MNELKNHCGSCEGDAPVGDDTTKTEPAEGTEKKEAEGTEGSDTQQTEEKQDA